MNSIDVVTKIEAFIKNARETPNTDPSYGEVDEWDKGYEDCLDALQEEIDEIKDKLEKAKTEGDNR